MDAEESTSSDAPATSSPAPPPRVLRRRRDSLDGEALDKLNESANARFSKRHQRMGLTVTVALVLFAVGSLMLYYGVQELGVDRDRAIAMLVVGSIAFLPGSYATAQLYGAWRRWPGYSYDSIPNYDEAWRGDWT